MDKGKAKAKDNRTDKGDGRVGKAQKKPLCNRYKDNYEHPEAVEGNTLQLGDQEIEVDGKIYIVPAKVPMTEDESKKEDE